MNFSMLKIKEIQSKIDRLEKIVQKFLKNATDEIIITETFHLILR